MPSGTAQHTCRLRYFELPNYWEEKVEEIFSYDHLLARLAEISRNFQPEKNERISVFVENQEGDLLHLGLGSSEWVIIFHGQDGKCLVSIGDETAEGCQPFLFPEWTDLPKKHLIAVSDGQKVLRRWFETGTLSDLVSWME